MQDNLYARVYSALKENWHFNDEGKAYENDGWIDLMRKYHSIQFRYFEMKETSSATDDSVQESWFEKALQALDQCKRDLRQVCDPQSLRIPIWECDHMPDVRKGTAVQRDYIESTDMEPLDGEEFIPFFVPYWVEDGKEHPAILVLSGGHRINYNSGEPACRFFQEHGYHALLMGHRVGREQSYNPCLDLQRAVRFLRYYAKEYRIDPDRIAALGFSLGGVIIASYMEKFDHSLPPTHMDPAYESDAIDRMPGGLNAFLGIYTSRALSARPHDGIRYGQYPPTFLVQPGADPHVAAQIAYLNDLGQHGVRVESHLFDGAVHNFGMGDGVILPNGQDRTFIPAVALWPKLAMLWLARVFL